MILPDSSACDAGRLASPRFSEAPGLGRAVRRAIVVCSVYLMLACACGGILLMPSPLRAAIPLFRGTPPLGRVFGALSGSLLIALAALVPCALVLGRRTATMRRLATPLNLVTSAWLGRHLKRWHEINPAGWPQHLAITGLSMLAGYSAWRFGFREPHIMAETSQRLGAGGALIAAAFPLLVFERFFARLSAESMPEAPDLARLLFVPVVITFVSGALETAAGLGIGVPIVAWLETGTALFIAATASELLLRTLLAAVRPRTAPDDPRAAIGSLLARLLRPGAMSGTAVSTGIRQHFGLDFSRSWAIRVVRAAFMPIVLASVLFCWFLSGVVSVGLDQRGVYERFGDPAEILRSGLHLLLPWPFGTVRFVEHGVVHSATIGDTETTVSTAPGAFVPTPTTEPVSAEDIPPPGANRLWDQPRPSEVSYLIARTSADHQSFEIISADVRVLFRVGLDDGSVHRAAYRTSDPAILVRTLAREMLANFFVTRTLSDVLGADRETIANGLRQQLTTSLSDLRTGIEVVAVIVEAAQPPTGAAEAYHHVQAARIDAMTEVSSERGRAVATASVAARDAHDALNNANGAAAEAIGAAKTDLAYFDADERAFRTGGQAFVLERYFANLKSALAQTALEILDYRLEGASLPILDVRPSAPGSSDTPLRSPRQ